jgi:molybdopterin-guanine dinucleotide biosynthesis protein A
MRASTTAAAIVAGGSARRFAGQDKGRLVVEGRTIIVRQVEILQRVASELFVVGPDPARYADLQLTVHPDQLPGLGAVGGILTALTVSRAEQVLVVACDLPFLDASVLSRLVDLSAGHDGAWIRTSRGVEPLLACYRQAARERVLARVQSGLLKAADLAEVLSMAHLEGAELEAFGSVDRLLTNINTPDDYARVQ